MNVDQYDEFGNYIGPTPTTTTTTAVVDDDDDDDDQPEIIDAGESENAATNNTMALMTVEERLQLSRLQQGQAIFGDAEVIVQTEDTESHTRGILQAEDKNFSMFATNNNTTTTTTPEDAFLIRITESSPDLMRAVAIVGDLHHGKSSIAAMLGTSTTLDTLKEESLRGISLRTHFVSMLTRTTRGKTFGLHVMDTPGHVSFDDDVCAALSVADHAVVVVDAAEGPTSGTRRVLDHVVRFRLSFTLVLNKIDRFPLELHLPPTDAFAKLCYDVNTVNAYVKDHPLWDGGANTRLVSPEAGTVVFSSAGTQQWAFSLSTFSRQYAARYGLADPTTFSFRLWSPWVFHTTQKKMSKAGNTGLLDDDVVPTFVSFVLEPIYKLTASCITNEADDVSDNILTRFGCRPLTEKELLLDTVPLLHTCFQRFFSGWSEGAGAIADALWDRVPAAGGDGAPPATFLGHICRFVHAPGPNETREKRFYAVTKVVEGEISVGQKVRAVSHDEGTTATPQSVVIPKMYMCVDGGRRLVPVQKAATGSVVLIPGLDAKGSTIIKYGVLHSSSRVPVPIYRPLVHASKAVVRVGVEPLKPDDLAAMNSGLLLLERAFLSLRLSVEETGERILTGTGELYLDSAMMALRERYAKVEIKVTDPTVCLRETVDTAATTAFTAHSQNDGANAFSFAVQPLEKGLAPLLEVGAIDATPTPARSKLLRNTFKWDSLSVKTIWAFGPDPTHGANILLNDTLPYEVNATHLDQTRTHIQAGFSWAMQEGPLCGEPVYSVGVRLTHATLHPSPSEREMRVVYPTVRKGIFGSILASRPRLLEPVNEVEILCTKDSRANVMELLGKRRGKVMTEAARPGLPLYTLLAHVPVVESFGFETDLRLRSKGDAFCQGRFSHWDVVPGDPLQDVAVPLGQAAPGHKLARDYLLKTRRRKGMEELTVAPSSSLS